MSNTTSAPAHRTVSSIRTPHITGGTAANPSTPTRVVSGNYGSPSSLRAEEDTVVIELSVRYVRVGFAGDSAPKAIVSFDSRLGRRAGDFRDVLPGRSAEDKGAKSWRGNYELWRDDLRDVDLGLASDMIATAVRDAYTNYLLTDSRPRKMMLALPSALPLPFLSCLLDTLFASFQPPTISLMPIPILATVAAGLRSALVIDVGWAETVVTGVYEFREINLRRTVRAGKMLALEMLKLLACGVRKEEYPEAVIEGVRTLHRREDEELVSRDECDEVVSRMAWCQPQANVGTDGEKEISIPLRSTSPPSTVQVPFSSLAEPAERALFATGIDSRELDDEELPLPTLIYQTLLQLPIDVRAVCMSRIIFIGEASLIPGLKSRIVNDLAALVSEKGWNPVRGKAFEQMMAKTRAESDHDRFGEARESSRRGSNSKDATPEDSIRVVDSMGAWQGGSLLSQLKIPAVSTTEREAWLQHGILGASKVSDVVAPGKQRHSMGSGGLRSVIGNQSSWTLGTWA